MRGQFEELATDILGQLSAEEQATVSLRAESTDFVRLNGGRVRQAGHVERGEVTLRLFAAGRQSQLRFTMGSQDDPARGRAALDQLRQVTAALPVDPYLTGCSAPVELDRVQPGDLPPTSALVDAALTAAQGSDLVGILSSGEQAAGFRSSAGHHCWDQRHSWLADVSVVATADKAVKNTVAGTDGDVSSLKRAIQSAQQTLPLLHRPPKVLEPGAYRVMLSPVALGELLGILCRDGFSERAHRTQSSALGHLRTGETLSPLVQLAEQVDGGLSPGFSGDGEQRPGRVDLVQSGQLVNTLVHSRTAETYGLQSNAAAKGESPDSLIMAGGTLEAQAAMAALGTGIYVSNLWYLNYSDHANGRITGMTRFATLWVEDGVPVAPIQVMRFDDTLYSLLGSELEALTDEGVLLPSAHTYEMRSTVSQRVPGALIRSMRFTL